MAETIKYNCVFGGGGIRGMCYIGVVRLLKELNIQINALAGSSVGAVFAALYASGCNETEIKDLFLDFNFNMFRDININIFDSDISLSKGEIFLDWLREKIGKKIFSDLYTKDKKVTFADLPADLYILTLDLNTNLPYVFSKKTTPDEEVAFAVRCSAGLPGLMKPVSYNGMLLVDGDLIKSRPAWKIYDDFNNSYSRILEFRPEGSRDGSNLKNPIDYLNSVINTVWYLSTESVYTQYADNDRYDFVIIDTKDVILFDFNLDREAKSKLIDIGYSKTKEFFLNELINKKKFILNIYKKIFSRVLIIEKYVNKNNYRDTLFALNEILADMNTDKKYIDNSVFEYINDLKNLFTKGITKQFFFAKKFNNERILKEKVLLVKNILERRTDEISFYISNYENIS